jgi:hypothetical protein
VIQAYVDDTGLDGRGPYMIFSALLGIAEDWAGISDAWKAALDEFPRIDYFKMDEAVGFDGEFYRFSESQRDYKLTRLARAVKGHYPIIEHAVISDLKAINEKVVPRSKKPATEPYFWPFQLTIQSIGVSILTSNPDFDEPFEIFFDENVIFGPRAKAWYPIIRAMSEPKLKAILPVEPFFRDDMNTMPLQAADLTAWMTRNDEQGSNDFGWLREHMGGIVKSPHRTEIGYKEIGLLFGEGVPPNSPQEQWKRAEGYKAFNEHFIKGGAKHYVPKPKNLKKHPKR